MAIESLREACDHFVKNYAPGARLAGVFLGRRKKPMAFYYWHGDRLYCVTFKRAFFRNFYSIFRETFEQLGLRVPSGPGQSMNVELLNQARDRGAEMVVVMPDGSVYSYPAKDWLEWAVGHRTVRRTMSEASAEASIPVSIMEKWTSPMPPATTPPELERLAKGRQTKLTAYCKSLNNFANNFSRENEREAGFGQGAG